MIPNNVIVICVVIWHRMIVATKIIRKNGTPKGIPLKNVKPLLFPNFGGLALMFGNNQTILLALLYQQIFAIEQAILIDNSIRVGYLNLVN